MEKFTSQIVNSKELASQIDVFDESGSRILFDMCFVESPRCAVVTNHRFHMDVMAAQEIFSLFRKLAGFYEHGLFAYNPDINTFSQENYKPVCESELVSQKANRESVIEFRKTVPNSDVLGINGVLNGFIAFYSSEEYCEFSEHSVELISRLIDTWAGIKVCPSLAELDKLLDHYNCIGYVQQGEKYSHHGVCVFWYRPGTDIASIIEGAVKSFASLETNASILTCRSPTQHDG